MTNQIFLKAKIKKTAANARKHLFSCFFVLAAIVNPKRGDVAEQSPAN